MSVLIISLLFVPLTLAITINGIGGPTFWPFLQTAYNSYKLIEPSFELEFTSVASAGPANSGFVANDTFDFALIDGLRPTPAQYQVGLQIFPYLMNTFVAQVNFAFGSDILLDRSVLADIYMGTITNWNHSAIQATNPNLKFPNATIKVFYRSDQNALNTFVSTAFSSFSSTWNSTYGVNITFPPQLASRPNFFPYTKAVSLNGAVSAQQNSIGYTAYYLVSRDPTLYYARLIHKYTGEEIQCNGTTLEAAGDTAIFNDQLDTDYIIDPEDADAWPAGTYIFMVIRAKPKDCAKSKAFFKFIRWVLTSEISKSAIRNGGCGPLPSNITKLVLARLSQIQCEDGSVLGETTNLHYTNWLEIFFFTIAMGMLIFGLALACIHIYHFSSSKINTIYAFIFGLGTLLTLLSPLFWFFEPKSDAICAIRIWTTSLGFSILLATMFSRTWQLNDIYEIQKHGRNMDALRLKVTTEKTITRLSITLTSVIFTNILILLIWTAVDPLSSNWVVVDDTELSGYYTCSSKHVAPWIVLELIFFLSLLCFGIYVIYRTWSFQRKALLVETRWVLLALYNVILNICAVIPILVFVHITERILGLIVIVSIDISGASIICAVLLPRLIQKLELSKSGDKDASSGKKGDSVRSPASALNSGKRKNKVETSRTPEDELAKRLEEPLPLNPVKGGKGEDQREQIELFALPTPPAHHRSHDDSATEQSTSHVTDNIDSPTLAPELTDRSPKNFEFRRGIAILEESYEDLDNSMKLPPPSKASISQTPLDERREAESALLHDISSGGRR